MIMDSAILVCHGTSWWAAVPGSAGARAPRAWGQPKVFIWQGLTCAGSSSKIFLEFRRAGGQAWRWHHCQVVIPVLCPSL